MFCINRPNKISVVNSSFTFKTNKKPLDISKSHHGVTKPVAIFKVPQQPLQQTAVCSSKPRNDSIQSQARKTSQCNLDAILKKYGITKPLKDSSAKPIPSSITQRFYMISFYFIFDSFSPFLFIFVYIVRLSKTSTVNLTTKSSSHSAHVNMLHDKGNKSNIWNSDVLEKFRAGMKANDESSTQR